MHTAIGGVGIDEIAFLQRQSPEIVPRHGAGLIELADEEVGKRRLRLSVLRRLVRGMLRRLVRSVRWRMA